MIIPGMVRECLELNDQLFLGRIIMATHMSHQLVKKILAIALSCCFLVVSTSYAGSMAHHATAHHSQDSHAQSWCDWLCKASQAIQTPTIHLDQTFTFITPLYIADTHQEPLCHNFSPGSRGPPASYLS